MPFIWTKLVLFVGLDSNSEVIYNISNISTKTFSDIFFFLSKKEKKHKFYLIKINNIIIFLILKYTLNIINIIINIIF